QRIDGDVVLHVAFFVEDTVLSVGGERVQRHVGDYTQLREVLTQRTGRTLSDAIRVPGFGGVEGFELRWRYREQCQRRNPQLDPLGRDRKSTRLNSSH